MRRDDPGRVMLGRGDVVASGLYTAKWREIGGQWAIEAELFVTLG